MKIKLRLLAIPIIACALLFVPATAALAVPPMPLYVHGDVTIGGGDAPIGTTISAEIEGSEVVSVNTTEVGSYGMDIPQDGNVGKTVVFKVEGTIADEHEYVDPWETPVLTLNLSIEGEVPGTYTLTVDVSPSAGGDIEVDGTAPSSYPYTEDFTEDSSVDIEAVPASGYDFDSWSGDLTGSTNPDTIVMDSANSVTANFAEEGAAPAPSGVGGTAYPANKLTVLAPWIALGAILAAGTSWLVLRRRRA